MNKFFTFKKFILNNGDFNLGKLDLNIPDYLKINQNLSCSKVLIFGGTSYINNIDFLNTGSFNVTNAYFYNTHPENSINGFNAINSSKVNLTTNIVITTGQPKDFYWIPNVVDGDWDNPNNWTLSNPINNPNPVPSVCLPSVIDNVHFENLNSSFRVGGINNLVCNNLYIRNNNLPSSQRSIIIREANNLSIYGDLFISTNDSIKCESATRNGKISFWGDKSSKIDVDNSGIMNFQIIIEKNNINTLVELTGKLYMGGYLPGSGNIGSLLHNKGNFATNNFDIITNSELRFSSKVDLGTSTIFARIFIFDSTINLSFPTNYHLVFNGHNTNPEIKCEFISNVAGLTINELSTLNSTRINDILFTSQNINNTYIKNLIIDNQYINKVTIKGGLLADYAYFLGGKTYDFYNTIKIYDDVEISGNACITTKLNGYENCIIDFVPGGKFLDYIDFNNVSATNTLYCGPYSTGEDKTTNIQFEPKMPGTEYKGLGNDTAYFCDAFPITINASGFVPNSKSTYLWKELDPVTMQLNQNNLGTSHDYNVNNPGIYVLELNYGISSNCERADTIHISNAGFDPSTLPQNVVLTADEFCHADSTGYLYADGGTGTFDKKAIVTFKPHGNFTESDIVKVEVNHSGNLNNATGVDASNAAYYELRDNNTRFVSRVSKRIIAVETTKNSFTQNGGAIVRIYYNPTDLTAMQDLTGVTQLGTPIMQWFKSTKHNAQDVINDFTAEDLANAVAVTPINSGIEGNLNYVEFQVSSFSTFGYFVTNNNFALLVTFNSFTGMNNGCTNDLT